MSDPTASDFDCGPTTRGFRPGDEVFGRYRLERPLGRGGMGVVWLAEDRHLGEPVALKFLPEATARDGLAVEQLKHEVRRARLLAHPGIVRIHGFETDGTLAAVAMEAVEGRTLAELRLARPGKVMAPADIEPWLGELCAALDHAHGDAGVVHCDLKPGNIMITAAGRVKVLDFGIAASIGELALPAPGNAAGGTLAYMSPQQLMGMPATPADDIYGLGALLYEVLTGKPPFFRGDLRHLIRCEPPTGIAERRRELGVDEGLPDVPASWEHGVLAALEKEPERRPGSAGELLRFLTGADAGARGEAATAGPVPAAPAAKAETGAVSGQRMPQPAGDAVPTARRARPVRRNAALVAVVAVMVAGLAVWGWFETGNRRAVTQAMNRLEAVERRVHEVSVEIQRVRERASALTARGLGSAEAQGARALAWRALADELAALETGHDPLPIVRSGLSLAKADLGRRAQATAARAEGAVAALEVAFAERRARRWAIPLVAAALRGGWLESLRRDEPEALVTAEAWIRRQLAPMLAGETVPESEALLPLWRDLHGADDPEYLAWEGEAPRRRWFVAAPDAVRPLAAQLSRALREGDIDGAEAALEAVGTIAGVKPGWSYFDDVGGFFESRDDPVRALRWWKDAARHHPREATRRARIPVAWRTDAPGAYVTIDGEPRRGPLALPHGTHAIRVEAPYHQTVERTVVVQDFTPVDLGLVELTRLRANLAIEVRPADAMIELALLDESESTVERAQGAHTFAALPAGRYRVVATHPSLPKVERTVEVVRDATVEIAMPHGGVSVASEPSGARVIDVLSGVALGTTPLSLPVVAPGAVRLRVETNPRNHVTRNLVVRHGEQTALKVDLRGGRLRIVPDTDEVAYVIETGAWSEEAKGEWSHADTLAGEYVVRRPGWEKPAAVFNVAAGEEVRREVPLAGASGEIRFEPADAQVAAPGLGAAEGGVLRLAGVPPGTYTLEVRKPGYLPRREDFTFASGEVVAKIVTLEEDKVLRDAIAFLTPYRDKFIAYKPEGEDTKRWFKIRIEGFDVSVDEHFHLDPSTGDRLMALSPTTWLLHAVMGGKDGMKYLKQDLVGIRSDEPMRTMTLRNLRKTDRSEVSGEYGSGQGATLRIRQVRGGLEFHY